MKSLYKTFTEFVDKYKGKRVDVDNYPNKLKHGVGPYQCKDLNNAWTIEITGKRMEQGNAKDMAIAGKIPDHKPIPIGEEIYPADQLIFHPAKSNGYYGHIALAMPGCTKDKLVFLEQNGRLGSGEGRNGDEIRIRVIEGKDVYKRLLGVQRYSPNFIAKIKKVINKALPKNWTPPF